MTVQGTSEALSSVANINNELEPSFGLQEASPPAPLPVGAQLLPQEPTASMLRSDSLTVANDETFA